MRTFIYEYSSSSLVILVDGLPSEIIPMSVEQANKYILDNYGLSITFLELNKD